MGSNKYINRCCVFFKLHFEDAASAIKIGTIVDQFNNDLRQAVTVVTDKDPLLCGFDNLRQDDEQIVMLNSPYGGYVLCLHKNDALNIVKEFIELCERNEYCVTIGITDGYVKSMKYNWFDTEIETYIGRPLNDAARLGFIDKEKGKVLLSPAFYNSLKSFGISYFNSFSSNQEKDIIKGKQYFYHVATDKTFFITNTKKEIASETDEKRSCSEKKVLLIDLEGFTREKEEYLPDIVSMLWNTIRDVAEDLSLHKFLKPITAGDAVAFYSSPNVELLKLAENILQSAIYKNLNLHFGLDYGYVSHSNDNFLMGPVFYGAEKAASKVESNTIALQNNYISKISPDQRDIYKNRIEPTGDPEVSTLVTIPEYHSLNSILNRMNRSLAETVWVLSNHFLILRPKEEKVRMKMVNDIIDSMERFQDRTYIYLQFSNDIKMLESCKNLFESSLNGNGKKDEIMRRIEFRHMQSCGDDCSHVILSKTANPHIVIWKSKDGKSCGALTLPTETEKDIKYSKWIYLPEAKVETLIKDIELLLPEAIDLKTLINN